MPVKRERKVRGSLDIPRSHAVSYGYTDKREGGMYEAKIRQREDGVTVIDVTYEGKTITAVGVTDLAGQCFQLGWSRQMAMEAWSRALQR
jgi:hypothetical protein